MTTVYEIPTAGAPKVFTTSLASGVYQFRLTYANASNGEGGWILDIADPKGTALVCGIPLVTGCDLVASYAYLGITGALYVVTDGDPSAVPTFSNLGSSSHLYLDPNAANEPAIQSVQSSGFSLGFSSSF